jgi:hypothetical protein
LIGDSTDTAKQRETIGIESLAGNDLGPGCLALHGRLETGGLFRDRQRAGLSLSAEREALR